MRVFLDSSVLIPVFIAVHPDHVPSHQLLAGCVKDDAYCGSHSLAEVYSTLTGRYRLDPDRVLLFLEEIRSRLTVIELTAEEYFTAIGGAVSEGIVGGGIYDAFLAGCAIKAGAEKIYTWNVKHFLRLGPDIASRVTTP